MLTQMDSYETQRASAMLNAHLRSFTCPPPIQETDIVVSVSFSAVTFEVPDVKASMSRAKSLDCPVLRLFLMLQTCQLVSIFSSNTYESVTCSVFDRSITRMEMMPVKSPPSMNPMELLSNQLNPSQVE